MIIVAKETDVELSRIELQRLVNGYVPLRARYQGSVRPEEIPPGPCEDAVWERLSYTYSCAGTSSPFGKSPLQPPKRFKPPRPKTIPPATRQPRMRALNTRYTRECRSFVQMVRHTARYRDWRDQVLEAKGRACVLCGSNDQVQVDHIVPLGKLLKGVETFHDALSRPCVFDVDNGRPICIHCHIECPTTPPGCKALMRKRLNDRPRVPCVPNDPPQSPAPTNTTS